MNEVQAQKQQELFQMSRDLYAEAKRSGMTGPFVIIYAEPGHNAVRLIAEHHPTVLASRLNAKVLDLSTGTLQALPKVFADDALVGLWTLEDLIKTMKALGAPNAFIECVTKAINDSCDCWFFGHNPQLNAPLIAPFPEAIQATDTRKTEKSMTPQEVIHRNLGKMNLTGRRYSRLPEELKPWYCYTIDGGHRIMSILRDDYQPGMSFEAAADFMVPAPVKTVLRGYTIEDGMVVLPIGKIEGMPKPFPVKVPVYSGIIGLTVPDEDDEF